MKQNKMESMPMPKLILDMTVPLAASLLIQSLYNIVDSIFVARIGENALTAVSLAYPVQIVMVAVAVGTSVGVNSLLSRNIGAKHYEAAGQIASTGVLLAGCSFCLFMLLGIFCSSWFVSLFTSDEAIAGYCRQYLSICMIFCAGTFTATMFQRFLQAIGNTFDSMLCLTAGALTNLILDPILIFGLLGFPEMGIRGAAIATVIGQWADAFMAITLNRIRNPVIRISFHNFHPKKEFIPQIYKVGFPTILTQAMGSIMTASVNAIFISISSTAVAFFGVYYKLQNFLFMSMSGLGQAAIPIIGYNYGAKKNERILSFYKTALPAAVIISLAGTVVFLIFPKQLLMLFSAGTAMLAIGIPALRIISISFVCASITMVLGYSMSGLGNGLINMVSTSLRQLILLLPSLYLLLKTAGLPHAWCAFWISEAAAVIYAVYASRKELKKKHIFIS